MKRDTYKQEKRATGKIFWTSVIKKVEDIFFKLQLKIAYRFHCRDQG